MTQKVALITGGASGIGKSTAMILARKGINVVISGRREGLGEKAVEEIRAQGGGDAAFVAADVDDEAQARGMVEFAMKTYGRLDLAVNNAGISNETKTIGDSDIAKFQAMLQTNVVGVYLCMKYEIEQMLKNGGGSIVNLASIAGLNGIPWAGPYAATKHAVVGLTKSGALDYATQRIESTRWLLARSRPILSSAALKWDSTMSPPSPPCIPWAAWGTPKKSRRASRGCSRMRHPS